MSLTAKHKLLIALGIFILALIPRIYPQSILTIDENTFWIGRSLLFREAILDGDWGRTLIAPHPGVITMWMGTLGISLDLGLNGSGHALSDYFGFLQTIRVPMGVLNALAVAAGYLLMDRLLRRFEDPHSGSRIAILAALMWALNPFVIANSQILHTDAPSTSFIVLSLLAGLIAFGVDETQQTAVVRWRFLLASGLLGGLAALAKLPAVIIGPAIFLAVFGVNLRVLSNFRWVRRLLLPMMAWGLAALASWVLLWPGAWVDFPASLELVTQGLRMGASEHNNFLFGRAVADPGLPYYPVAILLRLTPWAFVGLVALGVAYWRGAFRQHGRLLAALGMFILIFLLLMTLQSKKFDRYVLPVFPVLDLFAAMGLIWLADRIAAWWANRRADFVWTSVRKRLLWLAVVLVMSLNVAFYFPYLFSYFNPLLGGGAVAEDLILVGWGEGLDRAAQFIREDSGADCDHQIMSSWGDILTDNYLPCSRFYPMNAGSFAEIGGEGYVILYINQVQSRWDNWGIGDTRVPEVMEAVENVAPLHTVKIHGITYAWIYRAADIPQVQASRPG